MTTLLEFGSAWLIFTFSLYQGLLELNEQLSVVREQKGQSEKKVSPWLWLLPPLKVLNEKKRTLKILAENNVSRDQLSKVIGFLDKATGWFYVALGGWLLAIAETYSLVEEHVEENVVLIFVIVLILLTDLGIANGFYRTSDKRKKKALMELENQLQQLNK